MKAPPSPPARQLRIPDGFTEQDVCNYAHHLWIQSGMSFEGDPWAEARACLAAHLPPSPTAGGPRAKAAARPRSQRVTPPRGSQRRVDPVTEIHS